LRDQPGAPAQEQRLRPEEADADSFKLKRAWPLVAVWLLAVLAGAIELASLLRAR
jgi:hypothetical protein